MFTYKIIIQHARNVTLFKCRNKSNYFLWRSTGTKMYMLACDSLSIYDVKKSFIYKVMNSGLYFKCEKLRI